MHCAIKGCEFLNYNFTMEMCIKKHTRTFLLQRVSYYHKLLPFCLVSYNLCLATCTCAAGPLSSHTERYISLSVRTLILTHPCVIDHQIVEDCGRRNYKKICCI